MTMAETKQRSERSGPREVVVTEDVVRAALWAELKRRDMTRAMWAAVHGFSGSYISCVLNGHRGPSQRLCESLGFKRKLVVTYVREEK